MLLEGHGAEVCERLRWRIVESPDQRFSLKDGERDVGPVCGYVVCEGLGGVGETAAAQTDGELEDVVVGDDQAGESQRSAQNEGDDQHR